MRFTRTPLLTLAFALAFLSIAPSASADTTIPGANITVDTTWSPAGGTYIITSSVAVADGATLTILPGTVVKMNPDQYFFVDGTLTLGGVDGELVTITSIKDDSVGGDTNGDGNATSPGAGDWGSILISSTGVVSGTNAHVAYGGQTVINGFGNLERRGLFMLQGGTLTLADSSLSYGQTDLITQLNQQGGVIKATRTTFANADLGMQTHSATVELEQNTFTNMNLYAVWLADRTHLINHGGNTGAKPLAMFNVISGNETWVKDTIPYYTSGINIPPGGTLTILPGAVVKIETNSYPFNIDGTLTIGDASAGEKVTITSVRDDSVLGDTNSDGAVTTAQSGDWISFLLNQGGVATIANTDIRYGGNATINGFGNLVRRAQINNAGGSLTLDGAHFSMSNGQHITQSVGSTVATNSEFDHSNVYGIFVSGGTLTVNNSSIHDNTAYGLFNATSQTIDASQNWWGAVGGPTHAANPFGAGDKVSDNVDYGDWLTNAPQGICTPGSPNCNSNVLFLPGMMGSRLYDDTGYEAWLPSLAGDALMRLPMNADGTSVHDISTGEIVDTAYVITGIYDSFAEKMNELRSQGAIHAWDSAPYDWRLDYDTLLSNGRKLPSGKISYLIPPEAGHDPYIIETLRKLASSSPTGKVTIIAHSNGGLLTKALTNKLGAEASQLIDKIVFIDVPQLGTPKALAGLLHGAKMGLPEFMPILFTEAEARNLGQNMPLTYNLLPSGEYFHYVDDSVLDIDQSSLPDWVAKYGTTTHSTLRMSNFALDITRTKPNPSDLTIPEILNPALFAKAVATHDALDHWVPPPGVQFTTIAGWGVETLSGIGYKNVTTCAGVANGQCVHYGKELTITLKQVIDGDGTVVEPSQHWANGAGVTRYWVNLNDYNDLLKQVTFRTKSHADILEVPSLSSLLKDIVVGTTNQLDYISNVRPAYSGGNPRLHFTLHSPLTLGFTDALGNYTGSTATSTEFNTPGVTYERYGDVQWLSVPKELAGQLMLRGVASGSFTLDAEEVNGNQILSTASFEGIPSATSTIVTMNILPAQSVTASSTLVVDEDGNGTPDITLRAVQNSVVLLPSPTTLDLTPPTTTASTTGTLGTNGWYTSNALVTLTATDTESGVATTSYSLNGSTWLIYTSPFTINTEGTTTVRYYSTDKAGNSEATNTLALKIDKSSPEASISVSPSTQDILVEGTDHFGTTTVAKDSSGNVTVTDQAGHTTKFFFTKTYAGKQLTYAKLTGVQYDTQPKVTLPSSSFLYIWDTKTPVTLISQTIAIDNTFLIQATYDKSKNKTTIVVLKKNSPIQTQSFAGLKVVKLTTNKGVVGYSW